MTGEEIVMQARNASRSFDESFKDEKVCKKFSGAVTVELIKRALAEEGIPTSARDVFIKGIPVEIDLVVPFREEEPSFSILYEPRQVAVALEVKKLGVWGKDDLDKLQKNFGLLRKLGVTCAYVSLEDGLNYRWKVSEQSLGFPCFTFAWLKGKAVERTQDWHGLLTFLRHCMSVPSAAVT